MLSKESSAHLPALTMNSVHRFKVICNILRATGISVRMSSNDSGKRMLSQKSSASAKTQNSPESPSEFVLKSR